MKTLLNDAERLKLFIFPLLAILVSLIVLLSLKPYNVNLFNVSRFITYKPLNVTQAINEVHSSELEKPINGLNPDQKQINVTSSDEEEEEEKCNVFEGKWVHDPKSSPLYNASRCPFLGEQVNCRQNGRPEFEYEKWTWEPKGTCNNITWKFNGTQMLEKIRDKRVIIVGDSLNRNQWESLACLLYSSLPSSTKSRVEVDNGSYKMFRAKEYNGSVEFFWSPYLVAQVMDKNNGDGILNLHKLVPSASQWKGADVMVFNTGHWWAHHSKYQSWDDSQSKEQNVTEIETISALGLAMETWSRWIDRHVDPTKTRVFFRSISPDHKGRSWCYNQTEPITEETYAARYPHRVSQIVEAKIQEMKTPVTYLNITELSKYRKDSHPSIYRTSKGKNLVVTKELKPESYADCSHWCLPGVPDTWNWLLFGHI